MTRECVVLTADVHCHNVTTVIPGPRLIRPPELSRSSAYAKLPPTSALHCTAYPQHPLSSMLEQTGALFHRLQLRAALRFDVLSLFRDASDALFESPAISMERQLAGEAGIAKRCSSPRIVASRSAETCAQRAPAPFSRRAEDVSLPRRLHTSALTSKVFFSVGLHRTARL